MASAGGDRNIYVWDLNPEPVIDMFDDDDGEQILPKTIGMVLQGHKNTILSIKWPNSGDQTKLYSCGAQNGNTQKGEVFEWDLFEFKRTR